MRVPLLVIFAFLGSASLTACAIRSGNEGVARDGNRITLEVLKRTAASNLFELIEQERPRWMVSRGIRSFRLETEIIVALDRRYYGDLRTLRHVTPEEVGEIIYLDGPTATATITGIGSRHVEAAIVLQMRPR